MSLRYPVSDSWPSRQCLAWAPSRGIGLNLDQSPTKSEPPLPYHILQAGWTVGRSKILWLGWCPRLSTGSLVWMQQMVTQFLSECFVAANSMVQGQKVGQAWTSKLYHNEFYVCCGLYLLVLFCWVFKIIFINFPWEVYKMHLDHIHAPTPSPNSSQIYLPQPQSPFWVLFLFFKIHFFERGLGLMLLCNRGCPWTSDPPTATS